MAASLRRRVYRSRPFASRGQDAVRAEFRDVQRDFKPASSSACTRVSHFSAEKVMNEPIHDIGLFVHHPVRCVRNAF